MKGIITQSNYIPWKGYFDGIDKTDVFVVYDEMQYTKRDWRNRNKIKTPQGLKWMSIPVEVKGKYFQKINETKISDPTWNVAHWNLLKENYKNAKCFAEVKDWLEPIYKNCSETYLTQVNMLFLREIMSYLGIESKVHFSSNFTLHEDRTQRLVNICKELGVTEYYSGPAAKFYMEEDRFEKEGMTVHYFENSGYKEYDQLYPPFEHGVSILDLIFNEGENSYTYLKK